MGPAMSEQTSLEVRAANSLGVDEEVSIDVVFHGDTVENVVVVVMTVLEELGLLLVFHGVDDLDKIIGALLVDVNLEVFKGKYNVDFLIHLPLEQNLELPQEVPSTAGR